MAALATVAGVAAVVPSADAGSRPSVAGGVGQQALVAEDFSSADAAGRFAVRGGRWAVSGGAYRLAVPAKGASSGNGNTAVHTTRVSGPVSVAATVRVDEPDTGWGDVSLLFAYQDPGNYYYLSLNERDDAATNGLFRVVGGTVTELATSRATIEARQVYTARVDVTGRRLRASVDGRVIAEAAVAVPAGRVGVGTRNNAVTVDDLAVTAAEGNPGPTGSPSAGPTGSPGASASPPPSGGGDGEVQASTGRGSVVIDFDDGSYAPAREEFHGNPFDIVANPAGSGKVARVTFRQGKRNEIALNPVKAGSEHCYSIDYYIPAGTRVGGIYTQWHERPDRGLGEDWRKPPAMVIMDADRGITIHGYQSSRPVNDNDNSVLWPAKGTNTSLGPVSRDTWMRFDYHIKWSYGSDGLVEVWRDNKKVFTYRGPNTYNDQSGNYWKMGIYDSRNPGGVTRTVYYDNMVQGPPGQGCRNG